MNPGAILLYFHTLTMDNLKTNSTYDNIKKNKILKNTFTN